MNRRRLRVGINGLGRIGRTLFRINQRRHLFDLAAVNDLNPDPANIAYLLRYDSTYGPLAEPVRADGDRLQVGDEAIALYRRPRLSEVPWETHDIDLVIEASGDAENARILARYVGPIPYLVQTHSTGEPERVQTLVFGVNEGKLDMRRYRLFSASICDTIALAPIIHLLEQCYGIAGGSLVTLHPWLTAQRLVDGAAPTKWVHPTDSCSGYGLGRAAEGSLIPKSTTAVLAADALFPGLSKKLEAVSFRVPTAIVGGAVLNLSLRSAAEREELVDQFNAFEQKQRLPIIRNVTDPLVSIDYRGSEYSTNIDQRWTTVRDGRQVRLVYWYDNEWGYASRVADLVRLIASQS